MLRFGLAPLLLLLVPAAHAQAPADTVRLGLADTIARSLAVSPEVDAVEAEQDFAEARLAEARASRFLTEFSAETGHAIAPTLELGGENISDGLPEGIEQDALYLEPELRNDWENPNPYNELSIDLLQPIWTFGELRYSRRAAEAGVEVEEAAVAEQAATVALRTGELYYNVLLTDALSRVADEAESIFERAQREVQRFLDRGDQGVDEADLFQIEIAGQEVRRRVIEVEEQSQLATVALRRQLFLPDAAVVRPTDEALEPLPMPAEPLETYQAIALERRPVVRQATAGLAAREALVKVERAGYFPRIGVGVQARYAYAPGRYRQRNPYIGDSFLRRSVRAGIGTQIDLNFHITRTHVQQAKAEREEVRAQLRAARQLVLFDVEQAFRQVRIRRAAMEAAEASLTTAREWVRTEQINFDLEIGEGENLIDAVQTQLTLEASYYEAVQRYNVAVLRLLQATGQLVDGAEAGTLLD